MTTEATQDAPTDASHRPAVAGQVERSVSRQPAGLPRPYYEDEAVTLYHGDALALLPMLPTEVQDEIGKGAYLHRDRTTEVRFSLRDLGAGPVRRNEKLPACSFFCELAEQEYAA